MCTLENHCACRFVMQKGKSQVSQGILSHPSLAKILVDFLQCFYKLALGKLAGRMIPQNKGKHLAEKLLSKSRLLNFLSQMLHNLEAKNNSCVPWIPSPQHRLIRKATTYVDTAQEHPRHGLQRRIYRQL